MARGQDGGELIHGGAPRVNGKTDFALEHEQDSTASEMSDEEEAEEVYPIVAGQTTPSPRQVTPTPRQGNARPERVPVSLPAPAAQLSNLTPPPVPVLGTSISTVPSTPTGAPRTSGTPVADRSALAGSMRTAGAGDVDVETNAPVGDELSDDGGVGLDLGWGELDEECIDDLSLHEVHSDAHAHSHAVEEEQAYYAEAPGSYKAAMAGDNSEAWKRAIEEELANHQQYSTWALVPRAQATGRVLTNGWTFTTKLSQDGKSLRYKARLFVRGCQQSQAQYSETSVPVTNLMMLRMLLHWAVTHGGVVKHVDVKAAYLNAKLQTSSWKSQKA